AKNAGSVCLTNSSRPMQGTVAQTRVSSTPIVLVFHRRRRRDRGWLMRTSELYQRYYGIYCGKVVSVEDPQRLGRIRIECAQFEESEADPLWAVVARPGGGGTSVFFTPDVGDQVIFGFQVGDVNGPVILGYAHHSGEREPPEEVDAATKKHAIVTSI